MQVDEGALQSDAYIDALLNGHMRLRIAVPRAGQTPERNVRHVIRLLETGLPRFHPSFLFEERLAEQLRAAAGEGSTDPAVVIDRRLLMGGASRVDARERVRSDVETVLERWRRH